MVQWVLFVVGCLVSVFCCSYGASYYLLRVACLLLCVCVVCDALLFVGCVDDWRC